MRHVRLLSALAAGLAGLVLLLGGATGAQYFQTRTAGSSTVSSSTLGLAIGSGATSATSSSTLSLTTGTAAYSALEPSLTNTGNDTRNALSFTVSGVSVSGSSSLGAAVSVTLALAGSASGCASADYSGAVVWSSPSLSTTGASPAVGSAAAATIAPSGSQTLCARYLLGTSSVTGSATVTFTLLGWIGTFTSNPVTWTQPLQVAAALAPAPTGTSCYANSYTDGAANYLNYGFTWYLAWYAGISYPNHYRISFSGSPALSGYPTEIATSGLTFGAGQISVTGLKGATGLTGSFTIVGLTTSGGAAVTKPLTLTYSGKSCTWS